MDKPSIVIHFSDYGKPPLTRYYNTKLNRYIRTWKTRILMGKPSIVIHFSDYGKPPLTSN